MIIKRDLRCRRCRSDHTKTNHRILFELGKPILGSCNGLKLANVVLGGQCGPAPKSKEIEPNRDAKSIVC